MIFEGAYRYSELQRFVPGITKRMLSLQLKELESDELIKRRVIREKPIAVSYSVTDYGRTLAPVIESMYHWGNSFNKQQSKIQESFN
ncbi:hypothetical protein RU98_GL002848 [Enterococcus caccae]|nr:hypothetical protein RU98_GL002848 [Enterococcus caccae]